ncbi:MAG: hypothetical protein ACRDRL_16560, partial [Sciscionella sp.]
MKISIIGTGKMGQAIAGVATRGGNTTQLISQGDTDSVTGEIVVLAVPHTALADILATRAP